MTTATASTIPPPTPNLVSVILTSRNEEADIGNCLRSLLHQDHPAVEIILVDNGSTDRTTAIARDLGVQVETWGPERSAQRNRGVAVSRGAFICCLDVDMIAPPTLVSECLAAMADPAIGAVVIPEESFGEGFWTACKILERSCYPPGSYMEAARFFRRTVFTDLGGYDEALTGLEDLDLHQRCAARWAIGHTATPIRHHEGRIRFWDQLRKKFRYGQRSAAYVRKHPQAFRQQGNPFRGYFFSAWRRLLRTPRRAAAMLILKCGELAAGGLGILVGAARAQRRRDTRVQ